MTTSFLNALPDLVMADGSDVTNIISSKLYEDAAALMLYGVTIDSQTYSIEVNKDPDATASSSGWCALHDGTNNILPPADDKARVYAELVMAGAFRIKSTAALSGATSTWKVTKHWTT